MTDTQRRFKFGVFCALVALLATVYPIRNATDRFNNAQVNADANEAASGSNDSQKLLSLGGLHSCAVTTSRGVKCWGQNDNGQLGDGTLTNSYLPKDVYVSGTSGTTLSNVLAISAGHRHTCALISGGTVKCWGDNAAGQLGDGTATDSKNPVSVLASAGTTLTGVVSISAGYSHTCVVMSDGTARCWGYNAWGQLGNGSALSSSYPVNVYVSGTSGAVLSNVSAISAGWGHVCAVLTTGTAWCWGNNSSGQLGDGASTYRLNPVQVLGVGSDTTLSGVSAISAGGAGGGDSHTCALLTNGGIRCWGKDNYGQLGNDASSADSNRPVVVDGFATSGAISISVGGQFACAVTITGGGKCWGRSKWAQIGDQAATDRYTPVRVISATSGTALTGVAAISAGGMGDEQHACVLLSSDGTVQCWGNNQTGQAGQSTGSNWASARSVTGISGPVDATAPTFSSAAVNAAGTTVSLTFSEAMSTSTSAASAFTVLVNGSSRTLASVSSSGTSVRLGLLTSVVNTDTVTVAYTDPSVSNDANAIQDLAGNDASTISTTSVTNGSTATASQSVLEGGGMLSAAPFHTCVMTSSGGVKCWGYQSQGALGDGQNGSLGAGSTATPASVIGVSGVSSIATGYQVSCAVIEADGQVKCWGRGTYGTLGNGQEAESTSAVNVQESAGVSLTGVSSVSGSTFHLCGILATGGRVVCWGYNNAGQLGDGTKTNRTRPVVVAEADGTALTGAVAVTVGSSHSCALIASGEVKCWGAGSNGQLGRGSTTESTSPVTVRTSSSDSSPLSDVVAISAGRFHTCAVQSSGAALCWGWNNKYQLGVADFVDRSSPVVVQGIDGSVHKASAISASQDSEVIGVAEAQPGNHTCVLIRSGSPTGKMKCWGQGLSGQLGYGSFTSIAGQALFSDVLSLSGVTAMSSGGDHTCALKSDSTVWCWGENNTNQLGWGSREDKNAPGQVVGLSDAGADTSAPVVSTYNPTDNASGVAVSANLVLGFNENVTAVSGKYLRICTGTTTCTGSTVTGDVVQAYEATNAAITVSLKNVTINPTSDLSGNTTYYVSVDAGAFKDSFNNTYDGLTASTSWNFSTVDTTAPTYSSASTNTAGTEVTLTFNEALSATTAATGAFSVVVNGTAVTPSSVAVSGSTVVLGLTTAVQSGDTVTFTYTDPTAGNDANAVQDSVGNDVASVSAASVTNASTVDTRAPAFVSASTSSDGSTITLTYSEALSATTASASAFSVVVGGSSRGVSSAVVSGSTVVLTLASAVGAGQTVTVAYTDPSGSNDANAVQDSLGTDATTLSATSVTNNVPQPSSGGAAPTNGTTTSTSSTSTTTTIASGPIAGTTTTTAIVTTTAPRRPRSTTTTAVNRTTTTVRATTTTTVRATTTTPTTSLPAITTSSTTTTSSSSTTTTPIAQTAINSVASSAIQTLQQAEEKLKTVEAQTSSATNELRAAQIQVGESRVAVLDPKSALVVAVSSAEAKVASLGAAKASTAEIAAAVTQLEDLKIAIAKSVTISIEKIAAAQAKLAAVLSDPSASAKQVAEAKAELVSARVPTVEVVAAILNSLTMDTHLAPVIIPGIVDNAGSGQIVFLDGPIEKNIEIVRINGNVIRMTSTDGFTLNISTRDKDGQPLQFNSRGGIVVKHGNFISISGEGFAPGTLAKTWLFSSPRELGNLNVGTDGSFAADLPITDDIPVGFHVAQVDGLSPDGEVRSLSLDVEILPNEGPAEYDPIAKRLAVAALIAQAMALLALSKRREDGEGDDDREQADVSEVSVDQVVGVDGTKRDLYAPPVIRSIDGLLQQIPSRIASTQQLLARIIRDGVYLRALTGVGGVAFAFSGIMVGFFAANSVGFEAMSPSFGWLLALVIVGSIDALAGGIAALTIIAVTAISGGIDSTDAIRGLLGLAVLSFGIPLVASTTRPFRRASTNSGNWLWTRASDVVLLALFGAWAAGAMYDALPGLYGFTSSAAGRTTTVQVVALTTLIVRFMLESVATKVTGNRLAFLAGPSLPEPSAGRSVFAILVRTGIMLFVAEAFIGNNIALWIGAAMYAIPKLVALIADRFPKSSSLKIWLPAGLLRTVVMLFVARWWASNISSFSEDPETQLQAAFVLLGIPSLVLTSLGWFAGGERKWRSTPISKVLGIVVLIIGVLTVRGVLFA